MNIENSKPVITLSKITDLISDFFISRDFRKVETPLVISGPVPEPHIDLTKKDGGFLRPSPEVEMKILLSKGYDKIFQIGPCFRREEKGRLHIEEFTMLEWYEADTDYNTLLKFTRDMMIFLADRLFGSSKITFKGNIINLASAWEILTVKEAFAKFADTTPEEAIEQNRFEEILVEQVEPAFPVERPVILKDYPAKFAALAKLKKNDITVSERWELYLGGIEISNTYSELTDHDENRYRFVKFAEERKALGKESIPVNDDFFEALRRGIPESSGSAMGIDRLAMIFNDFEDIKYVS